MLVNFPDYANNSQFNKPLFTLYGLLHCSILLAPFTFTWAGLYTALILSFTTICLGITLCYHRLLAHRSYQLPKSLSYLLTFFGCLAFQRGPIWWVACHRLHHANVDKQGDPHSPQQGVIWSHALWAFFKHPQLDAQESTVQKLARDLYTDPGVRWLETNYTLINVVFLVLLFMVGYWQGGLSLGLSLLVWGGFLRILYGLHVTWLVNSASHLWGYRSHDTDDTSQNNLLVALLTWGEGWHNNHHAYPRLARMGVKWYEFDPTYWVICLLEKMKLAKKVIHS